VSRDTLRTLVARLAPLDALAKGLGHGDPWDAAARAAAALAGKPLALA
jgi:hypothetical protein